MAGCTPSTNPESTSKNSTPASSYVSKESTEATNEPAISEVAVRIDTMMCVEGCFNSVKELLEKRPGIAEVRLAPQKEEGTIDNSMVYIKHRGELDKVEMERLILGAGFDKMEFVK
jgi:copper chaperone CopZ